MNEIVLAVIASLELCSGLVYELDCENNILDLEKQCIEVVCVEKEAAKIVDFWAFMKGYRNEVK